MSKVKNTSEERAFCDPAKPVPFRVVRNSRESLIAQVVSGISRAVADGYYKPGEVMPRAMDVGHALGVSFTVMRQAYARLARAGVINPRRHTGTVVMGGATPLYQGRVVMVLPDGDDCFYQNILEGALRRHLADAGFAFVPEVVRTDARGRYDFTHLDFALSQKPSLVVQMFDRFAISKHLAAQDVPWILIGDGPTAPKGCAGLIHVRRTQVMPAFAEHCRRAGVKSVLQVGVLEKDADARPALAVAGVRAEEWIVRTDRGFQRIEEVQRCTVDAFERRFAKEGRSWLPELIFFKDDFVAMGGMTALLRNGVRVPEDVKVVTWANKGIGPVYSRAYTRMEMDPQTHGEVVSGIVLQYLQGKAFPVARAHVGPVYIVGETFPDD